LALRINDIQQNDDKAQRKKAEASVEGKAAVPARRGGEKEQ
jgi:hypothetical protein